ncbi:MAG: hypothetical protein COA99_19735 [Moraxellaceae bacterium]|nr:MAG: hypothetical protein COA99_19735 [Moraxellaceae bacterium]
MRASKIMLLMAIVFFVGCSGGNEAKIVATKLMQERVTNGGIGNVRYYSPLILEDASGPSIENMHKLLLAANGDLVSYSIMGQRMSKKAHTNKLSGTFVTLKYQTKYKVGEGEESVVLFRNDQHPIFKVIEHRFYTNESQELFNKSIEQAVQL